jgi:hypothetical protein
LAYRIDPLNHSPGTRLFGAWTTKTSQYVSPTARLGMNTRTPSVPETKVRRGFEVEVISNLLLSALHVLLDGGTVSFFLHRIVPIEAQQLDLLCKDDP